MGRRPLTAGDGPGGTGYVVRRIPRSRRPVLDRLVGASRRFQVHALIELDVSAARQRIAIEEAHVSWTGFLAASLGRAVARHPDVNARRAGNRIVFFERVDVGATVERHWQGRAVLDVVTIPGAERMSPAEASAVLHEAKYGPGDSHSAGGMMRAVLRLPGPFRRAALRVAGRRPRIAASFGPAVGITSIGMFTSGWGWAIPLAPLTVIATVGGIVDRAVVRDGVIVIRPMLPLTLSFDHAVIDGAPATRFTETLREIVENAAAFEGPSTGAAGIDPVDAIEVATMPGDSTTARAPTFDLAVRIRRPPAAVFALLADVQDYEPIPRGAEIRMVKDPSGPTRVGTRWHEWVRIAPLTWFHVESVVTEVEPPHRLAMDFHSRWLTGQLTYEIESVSGGTVLHHRETIRPRGVLRRLQPLVERGMRPRITRRLVDIRAILEGDPAIDDGVGNGARELPPALLNGASRSGTRR